MTFQPINKIWLDGQILIDRVDEIHHRMNERVLVTDDVARRPPIARYRDGKVL